MMDEKTVFREEDVLTPRMREQIEAFYAKVDADLEAEERGAAAGGPGGAAKEAARG